MKKIIPALAVLILSSSSLWAQKHVKVSFEDIKEQCKGLPLDKRVRVTVARFTVTTNVNNPPNEFGANLATMLTNALQQVDCYRVLVSLKDSSDMNDEIKYGEGKYTNKKTTAKKGKQLGAQVVVAGEITEFSNKSSGIGVGLLHVGSNKVKIGFIIKMINPETRDVIFSKSINVEGKAGGGASIGIFGANLISSVSSDPAVANACEQGIIQAVEFLASKKDLLGMYNTTQGKSADENSLAETEITLTNADYGTFTALAAIVSGAKGYKSMEKALDSGTATFTVSHTGSTDDLLNQINDKLSARFKVVGLGTGKIELKIK